MSLRIKVYSGKRHASFRFVAKLGSKVVAAAGGFRNAEAAYAAGKFAVAKFQRGYV